MCCVAFSFWQVYTGMQAAGAESSQQEDDSLDFPNAIYIDGIDVDGGLHTGVAHPCGKGADCSTSLPVPSASSAPNANASYAYSATVVRSLSGKTRRYSGIMCDILMECRSFAKTGSGQLKGTPTKFICGLCCWQVGANYKRFCGGASSSSSGDAAPPPGFSAACKNGLSVVESLRAAKPLLLWDDHAHGRTTVLPKDWPK